MDNNNTIIEARAFLFDLLSLSFSYPTEELYQSLVDGLYAEELAQRVVLLPLAERYAIYVHELSLFRKNSTARDFNEFASEYISLFDYSKEAPPLHPYAHLYSDDEPQPVPVYQRLLTIYREFDIDMTADRPAEQPDHLSVQLEFFAYLHCLLLQEEGTRALQEIENAISEFCIELEWVASWAKQLLARPEHAFYHPIAQCLLLALDTTCTKNA